MKGKKLSDANKQGILWCVAHLHISQRDTADMYQVGLTTVQRLASQYKNNPEKFPGVLYWASQGERITLETPPLEVIQDPTIDLDRVIHTPREVIHSRKDVYTSPCGNTYTQRSVLRRLYYILAAEVLVISGLGIWLVFFR